MASDQQDQGLARQVVVDRETAYRLGITSSTIDQTLYDAYGQREVSTIFTQLNQYHVVLEVKQDFQQNPLDLRDLFIRTNAATSTGGSTGLVSGGSASAQLYRSDQLPDRGFDEPIEYRLLLRPLLHDRFG